MSYEPVALVLNPLEKRPIQILEFAGKGGNSYFNTVEMSK